MRKLLPICIALLPLCAFAVEPVPDVPKPARFIEFKIQDGWCLDGNDHIWSILEGNPNFLVEWSGRRWMPHELPDGMLGQEIGALTIDTDERVWVIPSSIDVAAGYFDTKEGKWFPFPDIQSAFESTINKPVRFEADRLSYFVPKYSPDGKRIAFLSRHWDLVYFDGATWHRWKRNADFAPGGPVIDNVFFDKDNRLCARIASDPWQLDDQFKWTQMQSEPQLPAPTDSAPGDKPKIQPPEACLEKAPSSIVQDNRGDFWLTALGKVYQYASGNCTEVFSTNEQNPFSGGRHIDRALVDRNGTVFLSTDNETVIMVAPTSPFPAASRPPPIDPNPHAEVIKKYFGHAVTDPLGEIVKMLFEQGMANPRGCDYRQVKVWTGDMTWTQAQAIETHGWVLPPKDDQTERFAICWNGLVYPVIAMGGKCSVDEDMKTLLAGPVSNEDADETWMTEPGSWDIQAPLENLCVSYKSRILLKYALLLQIGKPDLAAKIRSAFQQRADGRQNQNAIDDTATAIELTRLWLFALNSRAMGEFVRKEDKLALEDMRLFTRAAPPLRKAISKLIEKPFSQYGDPLSFVDENPAWLADLERRCKETPHKTAIETGLDKLEKPERIRMLIEDLENVDTRQFSQPGAVEFSESPIVQALQNEGKDAVEPLLDCLEKDTRLTRSVNYFRDFAPSHRRILSVRGAAYTAVANIMEKSFIEIYTRKETPESWANMIAAMREYWRVNKDISREDRWFSILANDNAPPNEWVDAAEDILRPKNEEVVQNSTAGYMWKTLPGGDKSPSEEALRAKVNPSVTELLKKRIGQFLASNDDDDRAALKLSGFLLSWDGKAGIETARQVCNAAEGYFGKDGFKNNEAGSLLNLMLRIAAPGDGEILNDYARWLRELPPDAALKGTEQHPWRWFYPMWRYQNAPVIRDAIAFLFSDEKSPWLPYFRSPKLAVGHLRDFYGLFNSPLIGLPSFRDMVIAGLDDHTQVGKTGYEGNSWVAGVYGGDRALVSLSTTDAQAKGLPDDGALRVCDLYAWKLQDMTGMPAFEFAWPEDKRDQTVKACVEILHRYGDRYITPPENLPADGLPEHFYAPITFPKLDHPATQADVRQGRAIFALPPEAGARIFSLAKFPVPARYHASGDSSGMQGYYDAQGKEQSRPEYKNNGNVWQSEEGLVDGNWGRFFGFAGEHSLTRVSAEDIEFVPEVSCGTLQGGFDIVPGFDGPPDIVKNGPKIGQPMVFSVQLYNTRGTDQKVPGTLYRAKEKSIASGMEVRLFHKKGVPPHEFMGIPNSDPGWTEMPLKSIAHFDAPVPDQILGPAQTSKLITFDLNDFFDITQPGEYYLLFKFDQARLKFTGGTSDGIPFEVR